MISRIILAIFISISLVNADTPSNCTFGDIEGDWQFSVGEYGSDDCDNAITRRVKLSFPNLATDDFGNEGTWTLIYNQGFEVVVHGRKYFGYSKYDKNGTSYCDETMPGWSHDLLGNNWACFVGQRMVKSKPKDITESDSVALFEMGQHLLFEQDAELISDINLSNNLWHATHYPHLKYHRVSDVLRMAGGKYSRVAEKPTVAPVTPVQHQVASALPKNFDWRNLNGRNFVSPVRNQGQCGSCYSFASLAMLEARMRILTNNTLQPVFAPQDIVECSKYSQGCEGGFAFLIAGKYAEDFGVVEEKCNPYEGKDGNCTTDKSCHRYYATRYEYVGGFYGGCNDRALQIALYKNGPVAIGFEVTHDFMQYKGGIYHTPSLTKTSVNRKFNPFELTNHAVLLVGWGEENGTPYWIVKNSWGTNWGEDGYFRIIRGRDELAIESMGLESFPII